MEQILLGVGMMVTGMVVMLSACGVSGGPKARRARLAALGRWPAILVLGVAMGLLIAPPGSAGPAGADAAQALFQEARRRRRQRWLAWIAAVVVTGAVVGVSAVTWLPRALGQSHSSPAVMRPAALRPAALRQVPPYFAQLTDRVQVQAQAAVVRSTLTGHVLATVTPPRPKTVTVQLSEAKSEAQAQILWEKLAKKQPELFGQHRALYQKVSEKGPAPWRLRTGGFTDQVQAKAFCDKVKAKGGQWSVLES